MYSKGVLNTSSQNLKERRGTAQVVPVDSTSVEIYKKQKRRAKYEGLSHLYQNDYKPAVYRKAVEYRNSVSYKKKLSNGSFKEIETFQSTNELKAFGLGPYLFIEFQRRIVWLFLVFSILQGVRTFINYRNNGGNDFGESFSSYLLKSTLGNYDKSYQLFGQIDFFIITIIPALIYFILWVFYLCWKSHYKNCIKQEEQDREFVKPEKFCVEVEGFQNPERVKEEELEELFSSFGPVYEVSLAREYDGKLKYFEELDELEEEIKEEELQIILGSGDKDNLKDLKRDKDELNKYINTLRIRPSTISAFVHYQFEKSKVEMLSYYNNHYLFSQKKSHTCMRNLCCCCIDEPEPKFLYKGSKLHIRSEKVPEPEDLNWDAYQVSPCGSCFRMCFAIVIILVFLVISCSVIGLCSVYISGNTSNCEGVTIPETLQQAQAVTQTEIQKKCYCNENFISTFNDGEIQAYCSEYLDEIRTSQAIQYTITFTSAIVNFIFGLIVDRIVNLSQPFSFSKGYLWKTSIYTIFIILNTVFLPLLIYADIFGFKATSYVSFITLVSTDLANVFNITNISFHPDFATVWYKSVSPIYTNYLIIDLILTWVFFFIGRFMSNKESLESDEGIILQKSMNEKISAWKLNVFVENAYFNLVIFMGLIFSGGIPILIPLAFINLFSKYIANRSLLQSHSSRIQGLSEQFNSLTFVFKPLLIMMACPFAAYMLTANQPLMSSNNVSLDLGQSFDLLERQLKLPFFIILAILAGGELLFSNLIVRFFSYISGSCYDKKEVVHPYYTKQYSHYARSMSLLHSYNPRNNKKYKNAIINMEKYLALNDDKN